MQNVWMLSSFATHSNGSPYPTCSAYTTAWQVPMWPASGGNGLAYCTCAPEQLEAANQDPEVTIMPTYRDALPASVIQAYAAQGATNTTTLIQLLKLLGAIEPIFLNVDPNVSMLISMGLA